MSFESQTFEVILNRALSRVPDSIDKREGSIIYDAIAPACYELAEAYLELSRLDYRTYADTAVGIDLRRRAAERNVYPIEAVKAVRKGVFNKAINIGERFRIEDTSFVVTKLISGFNYQLECEDAGNIGNNYFGSLTPINYIDNLTTAELTDIIIPGAEEESDESLRTRYFEKLSSESFGGNIADYKEKTKKLPGVGGCKVYPVWAGGGTVKLVILDANKDKPTSALVEAVQTAIDPITNSGMGLGIAPIDHRVTVFAVTEVTVNLSANFILAEGYQWQDVYPFIIPAMESYLLQLRQGWDTLDKDNGLVVRISHIESSLLQIVGIVDIEGTTLNGSATNLLLQPDAIPILGTVTDI